MTFSLQYFSNSISRLLLPVDGAHAAACEEMATAMSSAEAAAYKGLQQCIETVMAEVSWVCNMANDSQCSTTYCKTSIMRLHAIYSLLMATQYAVSA
jgi:hypothetical protein